MVITSRRMRWAGHIANTGNKKKFIKFFVETTEWNKPVRTRMQIW